MRRGRSGRGRPYAGVPVAVRGRAAGGIGALFAAAGSVLVEAQRVAGLGGAAQRRAPGHGYRGRAYAAAASKNVHPLRLLIRNLLGSRRRLGFVERVVIRGDYFERLARGSAALLSRFGDGSGAAAPADLLSLLARLGAARLHLFFRPVLVVGVVCHVLEPQALRLSDEGDLVAVFEELPALAESLGDLRVVHIRRLLHNLAPLDLRPHHERVHWSLDVTAGGFAPAGVELVRAGLRGAGGRGRCHVQIQRAGIGRVPSKQRVGVFRGACFLDHCYESVHSQVQRVAKENSV